jgi:hypothetical protein
MAKYYAVDCMETEEKQDQWNKKRDSRMIEHCSEIFRVWGATPNSSTVVYNKKCGKCVKHSSSLSLMTQ